MAAAAPPTSSSVPTSLLTPPAEENLINKRLPDELLLKIFSLLDTESLLTTAHVCRKWRQIASDPTLLTIEKLRTDFPWLTIVDAPVLQTAFPSLNLTYDNVPSIQEKILVVARLCCHLSRLSVRENAGFTVFVVPNNLTLASMQKVDWDKTQVPRPPRPHYFSELLALLDEHPSWTGVIPAGVYVMSNDVLTASCRVKLKNLGHILAKHGCALPPMGPLIAGIVSRHLSNGQSSLPNTASICVEIADREVGFYPPGGHITVGHVDMSQGGMSVLLLCLTQDLSQDLCLRDSDGVVFVRKL